MIKATALDHRQRNYIEKVHRSAESLRVGQILVNLGNNPVKFTDPGGEIIVRAEVGIPQGPTPIPPPFLPKAPKLCCSRAAKKCKG
jgi:hypothetical protein